MLESSLAVQWLGLRAFAAGACILSRFGRVQLFANLWTVAYQAPLSMGFSRQKSWSELPCPPRGDLPDAVMEPTSPVSPALQADSLVLRHWESSFKFQSV